jgi:SAM-dependent methyltransferase
MSPVPPPCRCCGSPRTTCFGRKRGEFLPQDFDFYDCTECGFRFVVPFSGYEIYNDAYYRGQGPDPYVDYENEYHNWRATDRALEFNDLARVAEKFFAARPPTGTPLAWLDFGCGAGGLLAFLAERKKIAGHELQLTGHDVGSYADLLRDRGGFRILGLEAVRDEPAARYDVICLIEVIEHIERPAETIALVARLLRPGGLLILTTGNMQGPVPRAQGVNYGYCVPEIHVSLFNPTALAKLYQRHGLQPIRFRYDGIVQFKVIKTLLVPGRKRLARIALGFPFLVRVIDWLYGTSAMPCATKPAAGPGGAA